MRGLAPGNGAPVAWFPEAPPLATEPGARCDCFLGMVQGTAHDHDAPATIREVVAVFDNAEQLETAVSALQSNGFDRADISFAHATGAGTPLADTDPARTTRRRRARLA